MAGGAQRSLRNVRSGRKNARSRRSARSDGLLPSPCQGEGRGFESRRLLQSNDLLRAHTWPRPGKLVRCPMESNAMLQTLAAPHPTGGRHARCCRSRAGVDQSGSVPRRTTFGLGLRRRCRRSATIAGRRCSKRLRPRRKRSPATGWGCWRRVLSHCCRSTWLGFPSERLERSKPQWSASEPPQSGGSPPSGGLRGDARC